jgi:hypothetical protein
MSIFTNFGPGRSDIVLEIAVAAGGSPTLVIRCELKRHESSIEREADLRELQNCAPRG